MNENKNVIKIKTSKYEYFLYYEKQIGYLISIL